MKDLWTNTINSRRYTHHTRTSAARLDRIYVTEALYDNKIAATIVAAAFTDHFAITLRIKLHVPRIRMGRGFWKLNITLLTVDESMRLVRNIGRFGTKCDADIPTQQHGGFNM